MAIGEKGRQLLDHYAVMARDGYRTIQDETITSAYNDMEIRAFREPVRELLRKFGAATLLDYGCGGSEYETPGFDGERTAREYFGVTEVFRYEPARQLDQRQAADAVVCFDVLEHVFIADLPGTVRELFGLARRLLVVNVACYPARALLPNGENAHITVRPPQWWKGLFDAVAVEFPQVSVWLLCSTAWRKAQAYELWSGNDWLSSPTFVTTK